VVREVAGLPLSEVALGFREGLEHPAAQSFINLTLATHQLDR
jgi:hypothetical protein